MPLTIPKIDNRKYQELLDEGLARIPVHTPEWTNFNHPDPGVTLVEVFAFLTENLLYRANQIPERNRRKFLSLLGVPLKTATSARGIVTLNNDDGLLETVTLNRGVAVSTKQVTFRTERGLDVLPIEGSAFYKLGVRNADPTITEYYQQLYASYFNAGDPTAPTTPLLYQTVPLVLHGGKTGAFNEFGVNPGVNFQDTVDNSIWIALLLRKRDAKQPSAIDTARAAIAGKTLSFGIVPWVDENERTLQPPRGQETRDIASQIRFEIPAIPPSGGLPTDPSARKPAYKAVPARSFANVLETPGVIELTLPADPQELRLWNNLDPLEPGVDDLPPALQDTTLADRVITWLRVRVPAGQSARLLWCGINATTIIQRTDVSNELVGTGFGEPDQSFTLVNPPVLPGSVTLTITPAGNGAQPEEWTEIQDLYAADPEVLAPELRQPPGHQIARRARPLLNVFALDAESGVIRFGDGAHGRRPTFGATIRANYAYSSGNDGNVGANAIIKGTLPDGFSVVNPVRTWGGADAESVTQGEKQITRYLQHRDRLVTQQDFDTIVRRTPGVEIGRLDVLPAFHPKNSAEGGYSPGTVTLLLLPLHDQDNPDAPQPGRDFINAVCDYISDRRLVTTEIVLRGPDYRPVYVAVGIKLEDGANAAASATVRDNVGRALRDFLSPYIWRLNKSVLEIELAAVVARVEGVQAVKGIRLAEPSGDPRAEILIGGLELPQLAGLSVVVGDPLSIDEVRGGPNPDASGAATVIAIPVVPEECV